MKLKSLLSAMLVAAALGLVPTTAQADFSSYILPFIEQDNLYPILDFDD